MGQKDEKTSTGCRKGAGSLFLYLRATGETKKPKYLFCINSANLYFPREKKTIKDPLKRFPTSPHSLFGVTEPFPGGKTITESSQETEFFFGNVKNYQRRRKLLSETTWDRCYDS
jgi:hypothetical protein